MELTIWQNLDSCLPITAIQVLKVLCHKLILSGHGPYLFITDEISSQTLGRGRVFQRNNVHGIQILDYCVSGPECSSRVFVWGGQSLRTLEINIKGSSVIECVSLCILGAEFISPDWILDVTFQGSAGRYPEPLSSYKGCLITAHNVIFGLELELGQDSTGTTFQLHEIAPDLKPVLYSADIAWSSPNHILVAAGTVFGEIIVWTCYLGSSSGESLFSNYSICIHHFFTGHEGSIFGVSISEKIQMGHENPKRCFLASCSDDRTIRVWDISACCSPVFDNGNLLPKSGVSRSTGFGTGVTDDPLILDREKCVAKTMGHASRIWGVYFLDISFQDGLDFNLLSRGEDATCQLWNFRLQQRGTPDLSQPVAGNIAINHVSNHAYHTGKNIWSIAISKDIDTFNIYSGGADGNLVSFTLNRRSNPLRISGELMGNYSVSEVLTPLGVEDKPPTGKNKKESRIAYYTFVSDDSFIATTLHGKLLLGRILPRIPGTRSLSSDPLVSWSVITTLGGVGSQCVVTGSPKERVGIIGEPNGAIWLYHHPTSFVDKVIQTESKLSGIFMVDVPPHPLCAPGTSYISFVTIFVKSANAIFFTVRSHPRPEPLSRMILKLPPDFQVTAASFIRTTSWLILGSRHGGVAIYALDMVSGLAQISPIFSAFHLHANDAISSIIGLNLSNEDHGIRSHIITTGRDGYYQLHLIESLNGSSQSLTIHTLHKACPPFGPNIEGAMLDPKTNNLILYGFKGVYFIVWNESTQTELMATECGGCHRVWTYHSDDEGRRTFMWTKASRFHLFCSLAPSHRILRAGGHGREIKSACLSRLLSNDGRSKIQVLATGAEDTAIRLFLPAVRGTARFDDRFKCQITLKKHTAGVQHLQWSPCGKFLFSSSGCEELYVWRIRSIPELGIRAMFVGECPKSKPVSDLRITHFDVLSVGNADAFLLGLVYSNSTVTVSSTDLWPFESYLPLTNQVFYYEPSFSGGFFQLIAQGQYSTNCLTHIRFVISGQKLYLITTSTDGHLATWELTYLLGSIFHVDGNTMRRHLNYQIPAVPFELECGYRHVIHQSSIKAMDVLRNSETDLLILCGGDDNALSVSITVLPQSPEGSLLFASTWLPQAHASAINAVAVIGDVKHRDGGFSVMVASSGNDQRLKLKFENVFEPSHITLARAKMGKAGRVACIFTPYMLSIAAVVCLILVALGTTKPSAPLNDIYFVKADLKNLKTDSTGIDAKLVPFAKGLQQAKAAGKLHDYYIVGLWNYCYKDDGKDGYKCSDKRSKYWFDPIDVWGLPSSANDYIPKALSDGLKAYKKVAQWLFIAYAVALASSIVQLVVGISAIFSRWGSLATTIFASVSALFTILASITATALYGIITGAINGGLKPFNIKASLGNRMFTITWLATLFAFFGGIFWLFSVCCCSGRSPFDHRDRKGRRGMVAEKTPYTYERVASPYGDKNMGGSSVPLNPMPPQQGASYEPYRHV
ncbi:WD repeat-containing protein 6 [Emydomyces testavorans]|uniref:WD repeat-containing protein 6 n=1 Tax=Emydomyces testavorans TaxID=2070801 RepID=A0AAF0DIZ4_9EURO|nr:WD repeat-containing protein 6 [Emydomyces testavorans]